jgi:hypothetical protein
VGRRGISKGSLDTDNFNNAADIHVYPKSNEVFVADRHGRRQRPRPYLRKENARGGGNFGRIGRYAGEFVFLHNVAVDSKGNLYTSEVGGGRRV